MAVMVLLFTAIATSTVAIPVVAHLVAPARIGGPLEQLRKWLVANNVTIMVVVLLVFGIVLIGKRHRKHLALARHLERPSRLRLSVDLVRPSEGSALLVTGRDDVQPGHFDLGIDEAEGLFHGDGPERAEPVSVRMVEKHEQEHQ